MMPRDFPKGTEEMWDVVAKALLIRAGSPIYITREELEEAACAQCDLIETGGDIVTIIACDGKTIAADGQISCSGVVTTLSEEKIKVVDGRIYASAGLAALWDPLIEWHRNGAKPADIPKFGGNDNWLLVVVDADGGALRIRQYCNNCVLADDYPWPWAWGMHARIALGAMYAGKTAAEAVELVCERTVDAGGNIQVVSIADALGIGIVRQAAE